MSFMPERELHQLKEWNATKKDYPLDRCCHQLFEEQVKRSPDSVAVTFQNGLLTYDELNRRANRLAHHLRALRIGPEVTAAICMKRSIEMLIAILGILKAGGTFLPLNPNYPPARLEFMLKDSQTLVLLTQKDLAGLLPAFKSNVICIGSADRSLSKAKMIFLHNTWTPNPFNMHTECSRTAWIKGCSSLCFSNNSLTRSLL